MRATLTGRLWDAFKRAVGHMLRAALLGLALGFIFVEALAAAINHISGAPSGFTLTWPPVFSVAPNTLFVHVMALVFALTLAYLFGLTAAVVEVTRGVIFAADHVDEAVGAVAHEGVNLADAVVDAVDGPNRHGFTGRRDPNNAAR